MARKSQGARAKVEAQRLKNVNVISTRPCVPAIHRLREEAAKHAWVDKWGNARVGVTFSRMAAIAIEERYGIKV